MKAREAVCAKGIRRSRRSSEQSSTREFFRRLVAAACLIIGVGLMLYPLVGTVLNGLSFFDAVGHYEESTSELSEQEVEEILASARAYNDSLRGDPVHDPFIANSGWAQPDSYDDELNVDGGGLMGVVDIPAIGVRLPLYHGTSDQVLSHGLGHIPQTSLPVGGAGTHAVITGHTGLPTARLFDDLVQLKVGDIFLVEVLGEERAYAVDDIRVVKPDEVESIRIDETHDYVTLMTCTPYGINTHRLLVRGESCAVPTAEECAALRELTPFDCMIVATAVGALVALLVLGYRFYRLRRS